MIYEKLFRPLVFSAWSDPEDAHEHAMTNLLRLSRSRLMSGGLSRYATVNNPRLNRNLMGLNFRNPVGLGGGFDKNARAIRGFEMLGFGFIEIGTVTWYPQPGNPRPRVFRYPKEQAIINRFGFNNDGAEAIATRLAADTAPRKAVLGISLGKSKVTPLDEAVDDYLKSLRTLYVHGDYFAVNVSSPNTPGLRELQDKSALDELLTALTEESETLHRKHHADKKATQSNSAIPPPGTTTQGGSGVSPGNTTDEGRTHVPPAEKSPRPRKPILVKIAPDLEPQALDELLEVCTARGVDGLIATNTTLSRDGLDTPTEETGGLSGRPLFPRSLAIVRHIRHQLPDTPIIGVGGIMSPQDAIQMLEAGADLLQVYTGLIYKGPFFVREINQAIARMEQGKDTPA